MPAAATSSETSPSSSRTTTISLTPASVERLDFGGPIVVPFFSTSDPWRSVCTVTPPIASAGLAGPNFMPPLLFLSRQAQLRGDLGHDRHRDLGRRHRADRQPDRRMDARDVGFVAPCALSRSARLAWVFREPSAPI